MIEVGDRTRRLSLEELFRIEARGAFKLPPKSHESVVAEKRVRALLAEAHEEVGRFAGGELVEKLAHDVLLAAVEDRVLNDMATRIAEAEAEHRRAEMRVRVLTRAAELASHQAGYSVSGDSIIEAMKPAFEATMAEVKKAAPLLGGHDLGAAAAFLRSEAKLRDAYMTLVDAADRLGDLRAAQRAALRLDPPQQDVKHWFVELKDPVGLGVLVGRSGDPTPWPAEPLARVVWLATTADGNHWLPTSAEMDATAAAFFEKQARDNPRRYGSGW